MRPARGDACVLPTHRALPFVLVATFSCTSVYAQQLTCYPIRSGETAAGLARRLTGDPRNRHQVWFQIVEPTAEAFIPKRAYERIQAGWHVCVATERLSRAVTRLPYSPAPRASGVLVHTGLAQQALWTDPSVLWWAAPLTLLLSSAAMAWVFATRRIDERRTMVIIMRAFAARFVGEFERPLFRRHVTDRVLNARLRFAPRRRRLEILVAPAAGRTYPNLADHRKNVEYDVERIVAALDDQQFVNGPLYAEGEWVVIPFCLKNDIHQEGGR
jgi:hypothetical protein